MDEASHRAPAATAQSWWEQARQAFHERNWPLLEGCLRRLLELVPPQAAVLDLLGHALLQQGQCQSALDALQRAMELGADHFWTPHKLGDARRGLQQRAAAVEAYELALQWGSDSPLTPRNLLEVLHQLDPQRALERLSGFAGSEPMPWPVPPPWLEGAVAAALRVQGAELAAWLCSRGCRQGDVRAVLWRDTAYRLDLERLKALLSDPCSPQEAALAQRILMLTS